jgi:hypothetical protein
MLGNLSQQQQQRIDELTEAVNILGGQVAALMAYIGAMVPAPDSVLKGQIQGHAQKICPRGPISRTAPGLAASQGVDRIVWLASQLQTPPQP